MQTFFCFLDWNSKRKSTTNKKSNCELFIKVKLVNILAVILSTGHSCPTRRTTTERKNWFLYGNNTNKWDYVATHISLWKVNDQRTQPKQKKECIYFHLMRKYYSSLNWFHAHFMTNGTQALKGEEKQIHLNKHLLQLVNIGKICIWISFLTHHRLFYFTGMHKKCI